MFTHECQTTYIYTHSAKHKQATHFYFPPSDATDAFFTEQVCKGWFIMLPRTAMTMPLSSAPPPTTVQWRCCWLSHCTRPANKGCFLASSTQHVVVVLPTSLYQGLRLPSHDGDVCASEINCRQFQPEQMRTRWMEHIFLVKSTCAKARPWMEKSKPERGKY